MATNNIRALFKTNGAHFFREGGAEFEVPKGSGVSSIFSASLWLGGVNQDALYLSTILYGQIGNDFFTGPISEGGQMAGALYDKFWRVTKEEVDYHKLHYIDPTYNMPASIVEWPAHGKAEWNESYHLAPYVDVSGNGRYSPELCDYPKIKGDEAIFFIQNDDCGTNPIEERNPLSVEILCMAYAFNSQSSLQNTIFLSYTIRNKSTNDYKDFYTGFFVDFELGYSYDDYIGCDSTLNLSYVYNGNDIDPSYGANPPVQGAMFLNQKMSSYIYFSDWNTPLGAPTIAPEYYNNMRAIWKDGIPLTYGGTGYNPASTHYTNFVFSGDQEKGEGWTERTPNGHDSEPNTPGYRRGVMSAGPFSLPAGGTINLDVALPWARSADGNPLTLLKDQIKKIQDYYNQHLDIKENIINTDKILLYPNPTTGELRMEN